MEGPIFLCNPMGGMMPMQMGQQGMLQLAPMGQLPGQMGQQGQVVQMAQMMPAGMQMALPAGAMQMALPAGMQLPAGMHPFTPQRLPLQASVTPGMQPMQVTMAPVAIVTFQAAYPGGGVGPTMTAAYPMMANAAQMQAMAGGAAGAAGAAGAPGLAGGAAAAAAAGGLALPEPQPEVSPDVLARFDQALRAVMTAPYADPNAPPPEVRARPLLCLPCSLDRQPAARPAVVLAGLPAARDGLLLMRDELACAPPGPATKG